MARPNDEIIEFIKRQPEPIKDSIVAGFAMSEDIDLGDPSSEKSFYDPVYNIIGRGSRHNSSVVAASAIGIIDYCFSRAPIDPAVVAAHGEVMGNETLKSVAQKMELRNAYYVRAQKEWQALRQTSLSFQSLFEYEASQRRL